MLNICLNTAFLVLLLFFFQLSQEVYCSCFASNKYETQLFDDYEEEYCLWKFNTLLQNINKDEWNSLFGKNTEKCILL